MNNGKPLNRVMHDNPYRTCPVSVYDYTLNWFAPFDCGELPPALGALNGPPEKPDLLGARLYADAHLPNRLPFIVMPLPAVTDIKGPACTQALNC